METTKDKILTYLLMPLAWLYGSIVDMRNFLFDKGIIKSKQFGVPVVTVGNLSVGGAGKTPHVEYLVEHLSSIYNVAILSRGYGRLTKGFVYASSKSTPDTIGDEPYQMYQKFGYRIKVAVCESRQVGISELLKIDPTINLIVLDDGFQHRYVKSKVSILLTEYSRPFFEDNLLPLGRLRESIKARSRAHYVIVTKCPETLKPLDFRLVKTNLKLLAFQKTYFTRYSYESIAPVFPNDSPYSVNLSSFTENDSVLLVTGIDNPRGFIRHFKQYPFKVRICHYPDHHRFSRKDMEDIVNRYDNLKGARKIIITTEKDAARLSCSPYYPQHLKARTYYQPIKVHMINLPEEGEFFPALVKSIDANEL